MALSQLDTSHEDPLPVCAPPHLTPPHTHQGCAVLHPRLCLGVSPQLTSSQIIHTVGPTLSVLMAWGPMWLTESLPHEAAKSP